MRAANCIVMAAVLAALLAAPAGALPGFAFASHSDARFDSEQRADIQALAAAQTPTQLQLARLDLAELYLAHLMLPEGRSVLNAIAAGDLDAAGKARLGALAAGYQLMAGKPLAADAPDSPLAAANADWPDYDFWAAINAIRGKDTAGIKAHLAKAVDRLAAYPPVYAEACLPMFLQAALDVQDWSLAKAIAVKFDAYPDLKARPIYTYLLGEAALDVKRPQSAVYAFRQAAAGTGPYAGRARLRLIELGLDTNALTPEAAQKQLQDMLPDWQGGQVELETLRRLAGIDRDLGAWPDLLEVLGRILRDYPDSPDAGPAGKQAESLISSYYPYAISSDVPLDQLIKMHRRITPYFERDPAFESQSEALADHLLKLGATVMAAAEYARIHDALALVRQQKLWTVDPGRLAHLKLREAEALAAGGQYRQAAEALAAMGTPVPAEAEAAAALQLKIYAGLGEGAKAAGVALADPRPEDLRRVARADFDTGAWSKAATEYGQLRKAHPQDFGATDAINMLLAAYRAGDTATARAMADALPQLGVGKDLSAMAAGLVSPATPISPLKQQAAEARIAAAAAAIGRADQAAQPAPKN